jgi:hypothetical protein
MGDPPIHRVPPKLFYRTLKYNKKSSLVQSSAVPDAKHLPNEISKKIKHLFTGSGSKEGAWNIGACRNEITVYNYSYGRRKPQAADTAPD